jgi:uncharacterized Zn finger protein (UPF0148 family)
MCPNCNSMNYESHDGETFNCGTCGANFTPEEAHEAAEEWAEVAADYPMGCDTREEREMDRW